MLLPNLTFSFLGRRLRVKHTVVAGFQPPTAEFIVLARMSDVHSKEMEMGTALLIKDGGERPLTLIWIV